MNDVTELLRKQAFALSCHEQFRLATFIAENVGYTLVPEPAIDTGPTIDDRVKNLEVRMAHLMPDRSDDV